MPQKRCAYNYDNSLQFTRTTESLDGWRPRRQWRFVPLLLIVNDDDDCDEDNNGDKASRIDLVT